MLYVFFLEELLFLNKFSFRDLKPGTHVHFIGIGGISMSALAEILLNKGYKVSGSDVGESLLTDKLKSGGAKVFIGHSADNIRGANIIIHTAAIKADNPEMLASAESGIPVIDRPTLLGELMKGFENSVAVAGTHGKTTTTSMISLILLLANMDPTLLVGEVLDYIDGNVRIGNSEYFVTEACEYCESFLKFYPKIGVILNVESDHLDYFKDLDHIISSFSKFSDLIPESGFMIANRDDENVVASIENAKSGVITFGITSSDADFKATNITFNEIGFPNFDIEFKGKLLFTLQLVVPGIHNVYNALAAIACMYSIGIDLKYAKAALEIFKGARRRFEIRGVNKGFTVISDYAHHPTEIKATLKAASQFPHNKIWCVFQPHTYTRTYSLMDDFTNAFKDADEVIITDIYAAREKDDGKVHSRDLVNSMRNNSFSSKYISSFDEIADYLYQNAGEGDLVIAMGAGSIDKLADMLVVGN